MEKYAKLMKGLEVCAGPDCCKDGCPYYGKTTGNMTCRARLLADAAIAINNELALRESAEEGLQNAVERLGELDTINTTICAERENLRKKLVELNQELTCTIQQWERAGADLHVVREQNMNMNAELSKLHADVDDLEAAANTLRADRDGMRAERDAYANECKALTREVNILHERCQVQQNEINALLLKNSKQDAKTDRPSVGFDGSLAYWCGRADALAEVVSSIVGEASGHE